MKKNTDNKNKSSNKQNTSAGRVNLNDYAGKEKDDSIAKQNADQYINDVDRSVKQAQNTNNANNKQHP